MNAPHDHQVHVSFVSARYDATWRVTSMALGEGFNEPYAIDLDIRSDDFAGDLSAMLGTRAQVTIERGPMSRVMFGILATVEGGPFVPHHVTARVRVSPALAALQHRRNSRVFTDKTVIEVLRDVLEPTLAKFGREVDFGWLSETYPRRGHITQYQETDYAFVSRLMEDEGIAFRFDHDGDAEKLILLDADSAYAEVETTSGPPGLLPMALNADASDQREELRALSRKMKLAPTVARAGSFDWRTPDDEPGVGGDGAALGMNAEGPELEDYAFELPPAGAGSEVVERRLALRRRRVDQSARAIVGRTTAHQLTVGSTFEVVDHPDIDLNGVYLVTAVRHRLAFEARPAMDAPAAGGPPPHEDPRAGYENEFEGHPLSLGYSPPTKTERPRIQGVVSARVIGDEFATDDDGRLRVEFPWDRDKGRTSSIPVMQAWAGAGWGTQFFPRAGMQVMVSFVDGDPDQPVVIGCRYGGNNAPPYKQADQCSGIKTASSGDAERYNELMFDDSNGKELVRIRAQKDFHTIAKEAHTINVGLDQFTHVGRNKKTIVDGKRTARYTAKEEIWVDEERRLTVDGDEHRTVSGTTVETFFKNLTRNMHSDLSATVVGNATHTVIKSQTTIVGANMNASCTGNRSDETGGKHKIIAGGGLDIEAPTMKVLAPGGLTFIGPTSEINVLGDKLDVVSVQRSAAQLAVSLAVARASLTTGLSSSITSTSISITGLRINNSPFYIDHIGARIKNWKMSIGRTGLDINKSKLKVEM
ncbi:Phage-related baseplate assembly protein [Enhygromyxa salina]|uniref:Phage-related baseplate assembly protein n=1 Tax=Enhygromyxa salina TaxID=215803 RepID=A0A2S9XF77_9BACT|nr:type VI secretion system tip protein TssI/VgrG [Enhygromyxa salina]PRP91526.1 Phage-related baseplate assembly protein [Enhygromyxa salina]